MSSCYKKESVSDSDLKKYLELYESLPEEKIKQFYNLHYCLRRDVPKDQRIDVGGNGEMYAQYFLKYIEGSFTKSHVDNEEEVGETVITLIDKEDLIGGDIIVYEPHFKNTDWEATAENGMINYYRGEYLPGQKIIPVIVNQEVGESIFYSHSTMHSVSKVLRGTRTVLVTWYNRPDKVLLVGNGTSILDKELGEEIDSFGNVVRFNSFVTKGYEKFTGSKTDTWFTCMGKHKENMDDFRHVISHSWEPKEKCRLYNELHSRRDDVTKVDNDFIDYYGLVAPSTGLIAIMHYLKTNEVIWIHGFDWWERDKHHYADNEPRGELHQPEKEYEIIKSFGDRIRFIE